MERVEAAVRDGLVAERWIEVRNNRVPEDLLESAETPTNCYWINANTYMVVFTGR